MELKKTFKSIGSACLDKTKAFFKFLGRNPWLLCLVLGFCLNFTIECLHRHSLWEGITHVFTSPLPFIFNSFVVCAVMSIGSLFKRRYFFYSLFGAVFLGFGIANCVLLVLRITPLEWADLQVVKISLITKYMNTFEIILIVAAIVLAIIGLIVFCIKCPKAKVNYLREGITAVVFVGVTFAMLFGFRATNILTTQHTKNLANAYKTYGFHYCFLCSVFDLGIDKPEVYTESDVNAITTALNEASNNNEDVKNQAQKVQNGEKAPNVIYLQLETFFDVNHLSNVEFSEDPIPNFTALHTKFTSGYLGVPSIGAGTANTEFEIISGMSLDHFGMGEYPYKTILQTEPSESICYNLKNHGYSTHAIHNNTGVFYDRNIVFANLGFDTFTSLEYMQDVEFTDNGWAKDNVLVGCINDCLDSSEGSDMVYTITVQSHGKYPADYTAELPITVTGFGDDEDTQREFAYYINQLHEVDQFIGDLLTSLEARDERTIVIMYGDHLPSFEIAPEDLDSGDLFATEFIVWDNFGLGKQDLDINSYQLGAHTLKLLGYDDGILTKLHQNFADNENYSNWLHTLQYDMLYGKKYAYGGKENYPYKTTSLKMGVKDIKISEVVTNEDGSLTVKGENFTPYSRIYMNEDFIDTVFVDNFTLRSEDETPITAGDLLAVVQVDNSESSLGSSKFYLVGGTHEAPTVTEDSEHVIYLPQGFKLSTAIAIIVIGIAVIAASASIITVTVRRRRAVPTVGNEQHEENKPAEEAEEKES